MKNQEKFLIRYDSFLVSAILLFKIDKNYFFHLIDSSNSWNVIE